MPDQEEMKRKWLEQRRKSELPYGEYRNSISFDQMPTKAQKAYKNAMQQAEKQKEKD